MLEEKLISLKKDLILFATLIEGMIDKSILGLLNRQENFLQVIIEEEENTPTIMNPGSMMSART